MRCGSCQFDNPAENKFCEQCGARIELRCSTCNAPIRAGAKFCGSCGRSLVDAPAPTADASTKFQPGPARSGAPASYTPRHLAEKILTGRSTLEGERRQVTVLFADMVGFSELAGKLDPEEVHQIMDRCFSLITDCVHRFEGTVNQYTGDGVMALFGAPIAHEDGPRRAVHAALGMQRALADYDRELQGRRGFAVKFRVGLNTGLVVVGRIGDDLRMDYTAVGDTTNLAARLQQTAQPGCVVISQATHKSVEGFFEVKELGALTLKGFSSPVIAYQVVRELSRRVGSDPTERGLTPLVGRARELTTLRELFEQVKAGHGQVVFVAGEPGIGKSRLLHEFRREVTASNGHLTWLEGRCVSFGQAIPLLPVIDQLRENFRIDEADGEPEI